MVEPIPPNPASDVALTLLELGKQEDLFQYPRSVSKDLMAIAAEKDLLVRIADRNATRGDEWQLANTQPDRPGVESWIVETPANRLGVISRDGAHVWVNVSDVGEGFSGSRVYDLAANYSFCNEIVFIGDPQGLSVAALRRRLENMLSSAVKYGTTDHLEPHPDQLKGAPDKGIPPLSWTSRRTLDNICSMVKASLAITEAVVPAATKVIYDVHTGQFKSVDGTLLEQDGIVALLGEPVPRGVSRTGAPGLNTIQRAALFRALLQGEDARRAVLGTVCWQQGGGSASLGGRFY